MKTVHDIMSPIVFCLDENTFLPEAAKSLRDRGISGAPVINAEKQYVGVISQTDINAKFAAVEASVDKDWWRLKGTLVWASGDDDPLDEEARGFDSIFDNPNFAGGEFSYWQRQAIGLFGVQLVNRGSLVPNLRSSKTQGQTNFVNPGLHLFNIGVDADITPRTKLIGNVNFLWFEHPEVLETFVFQPRIASRKFPPGSRKTANPIRLFANHRR